MPKPYRGLTAHAAHVVVVAVVVVAVVVVVVVVVVEKAFRGKGVSPRLTHRSSAPGTPSPATAATATAARGLGGYLRDSWSSAEEEEDHRATAVAVRRGRLDSKEEPGHVALRNAVGAGHAAASAQQRRGQ